MSNVPALNPAATAIPIPQADVQSLYGTVLRMRQVLQALLGVQGGVSARAVTFNDLQDIGLTKTVGNQPQAVTIPSLNSRGTWSATSAYSPGDVVIYNGAAYVDYVAVTAPGPNPSPDMDDAHWFSQGAVNTVAAAFMIVAGQLQFAAASDGTVLSNISGGSAPPVSNGLSAILDHVLGSTEGDILQRGASGWQVLAPGSANQVLQSGGAAALNSWAGLSALLDTVFGSTEGDILQRGASGWQVLAPPGSANQVLTSGGAAALNSWAGLRAILDGAFGTTEGIMLQRGASAWQVLAPGSAGQVLLSGGASALNSWGTDQLGVATNSNAPTGDKGEFISSSVSTSILTNTPTNLTTISLTAGDWEVHGGIAYETAGGNLTDAYCCVSTTTVDTSQANMLTAPWQRASGISATLFGVAPPPLRVSIAGTTTVYLVAFSVFPGTITAIGAITARRMR